MPPRDRHKHAKAAKANSRLSAAQPSAQALEEAETLQQRAERKRGREAITAYEHAANRFQRALDLEQRAPLAFERHCDAYFGLAEVLQNWAEGVLAVCRTLPDAELTREAEQAASSIAKSLFKQAVESYQQVRTGTHEIRADAAVNSGNTLAAWAELLAPQETIQMLVTAQQAYEAALNQESDAATWGNRADAFVRQAELVAEGNSEQDAREASQQAYEQGMEAYATACSLTSTEQGDDLPGLLHNWGVGLRSMAEHTADNEAACSAYSLAVQKLQASIQFARGDVAPYNALGDAYVGWAERLPDGSVEQQLKLGNALQEGYQAALHVNANSSEALVGIAEVKGKMGRLFQCNGSVDALQHFCEGAQAYQKALQTPTNLGSMQDRNEIRYNFACLLCLSTQQEAAMNVLAELMRKNGVASQDLITDEDFTDMRELPAFQHLIQQAQHSNTT
ncbi:hypothetical protein ABBQ32_005308 [Trebouxia sp. C0010 RCD-2024]